MRIRKYDHDYGRRELLTKAGMGVGVYIQYLATRTVVQLGSA